MPNYSGVFAVGVLESSGSTSSFNTAAVGAGIAKGGGLCKECRGGLACAGLNGNSDPNSTC